MADIDTVSNEPTPNESDSLESLENQEDTLESGTTGQSSGGAGSSGVSTTPEPPAKPSPKKSKRFTQLHQRLNIYLLLFGFVLFLAGIIILVAYLQNRQASVTNRLQPQSLSLIHI